jgi:hypothetical protein
MENLESKSFGFKSIMNKYLGKDADISTKIAKYDIN